jgi:aminopeptidase N
MKTLAVLACSILSTFGYFSFGQNEVHACAEKHVSYKQKGGQKTLTAAEESKANKYDLHYYELDLSMTNQNTSVSGTAYMHAKTIQNLDTVLLELFPTLVISDIRLNGTSTNYTRTNSLLKIPINATAGFSFQLAIDYAGTPPTPGTNPFGGSGVTSTYVSTIADRVTWTVSCPFLAHEWFPCKQILRDKVDSCAVKITVPANLTAASNGILENIVDLGNGTTRYEWKHRKPILYYLICATIAPYQEYNLYAHPSQLNGDSVLIQNFIYGNATTLPQATQQCDQLPSYLELYSDLFGLYPFSDEKYGQCVAPLGGGMEHQTMTTIGVFEKKITAHELAHSWFGDHVGIASFSDVWLSEGFATYAEYLMLENFYPTEKASLLSSWHNSVCYAPGGSVWFTDTLDISRIYNSRLSYKKGASIVHTLRHIVNNDTLFFETLRQFQTDFKDSVAIGLDLKNTFEQTTGLDLTAFFEEWYFGEGFPTYSTRWNAIGNDLLIEVSHTVSMASVTPAFSNPLEISFTRNGMADTTIRFQLTDNLDQFYLQNIGEVTGVAAIDPSNWIINRVGQNVHDMAFIANIEESELAEGNFPKVYPNPSNSIYFIRMPDEETYTLQLFDAKGQLLRQESFEASTALDVSNLSSGSYILEVCGKSLSAIRRRKIVKL